jgi:hypothetical protein
MPFDWPTPEQMIYRINRLRRVIAVAVALPVIVILGMALLDPSVLFAERATLATLAVTALIVGHVVLFPNVTLETIGLSVSVTALIISVPWIKAVAHWAPAEHVPAAFVILIAFAVAATGALMALVQITLSALVYAGPAVKMRLKTSLTIPCSAEVAHRQFALKPQTRRGRVLTGPADEDGFFDVAVATPHVADPENPDQPFVVRIDAKVLASTPARHDVMMALRNGSVTVTSQEFTKTEAGCRVDVADLPGDFTLGMHLMFWLTDQQADNLTEMADVIIGEGDRANGLAHGVSLLSVAGLLLSPREPVTGRAK